MSLDVEKLIKVVGLLASTHDGERASAARMASDVLKAYGVSWEEVFRSAFEPGRMASVRVEQKAEERADTERTWMRERYQRHQRANPRYKVWNGVRCADILRALKAMPRNLADWDRAFIDQVIRKGCAKDGLTEKQWAVIIDLANKAGFLRQRA